MKGVKERAMAQKTKINITADKEAWETFKKNCQMTGLNASRVLEVFMICLNSTHPLNAMRRFIDVTECIRKELNIKE